MTGKFLKLKSLLTDNTYFRKNIILTLVALVEVFAIMIVSTSAWVETISTVQIGGSEATGKIAAPVMTTATFDRTYSGEGVLDLSEYFNAAGNVHLASASSTDGNNMFFPKLNTAPIKYRKGTVNDINVNYISFSIIIDATNASGSLNFFFKQDPTITIGGNTVTDSAIRLAISKDGASTKVFSKSESASDAVIAEDGTKGSTTAGRFLDYVQLTDDQTPIFDVEYGKTATVTFTLWLEDPEMSSSFTGQSVQIEDLALVTDTKEYVVSFVDKTTSFYNGVNKNALYWVSNNEADLWVYSSGAKKAIKMKKISDDPNTWSANLQEFLQYNDSDLYFLRTKKTATAPTPAGSDTYNKWKTTLSADTSLGKTFTAYSNIVNSSENLGTWGEVTEILLNTEDSDTLPKPASGSDYTAADISMKISGVSYEMNYKNYNGSALWRCYIPDEKLSDTATFSFTRNSTTYTFNANNRGDSLKYTVTSSNTGYWEPPAVIKIIVDNNIDSGTVLGTASVSVGNYKGTEIKVTPKTEVTLNSSDSNNYRFMGWYTNSDYTISANDLLNDGNKFTPGESKTYTFYAKFQRQYHIQLTAVTGDRYPTTTGGTVQLNSGDKTDKVDTFLLDDGSDNANVKFNAAISEPEGYEFRGWFDNASGTGSAVTTDLTYDVGTVKQDYKLYAKFVPKEFSVTAVAKPTDNIDSSKVTFSEPTGASEGTEVTVTVVYKNTAKFVAKADTANGYKFVGWYTDESLADQYKIPSAGAEYEMTITEPTTLYAKFELIDVTLTAKAVTGTSESADGGTVKITDGTASSAGASDTITVKYGTPVTLTATQKDGYTFKGWYTSATGDSPVTGIADSKAYTDKEITLSSIKADTTVYARFVTKNRVYFANNVVDSNNYSSTKQWETPYCYVWQSSNTGNNNSWPGGKMNYDSELGLYYFDITLSGVDKVIFSGGKDKKPQTANLDLTIGATYYLQAKPNGADKYPATTQSSTDTYITITFIDNTTDPNDVNNNNWVQNASATLWAYDGTNHYQLTKASDSNTWTTQNNVPSSVTNITFYRCENDFSSTVYWNKWEANPRTSTTYTATLDGIGSWTGSTE